jgi:hypothetical protein
VDVTGIGSTRTDIFIDRSFTDSLYKKWPWMKAFADHTDQVLNCPPGFDSAKYPEIQKILSKAFESVLFENVAPATAARNAQMEALAIF